jgi:type IV secretory pathway component VirB8
MTKNLFKEVITRSNIFTFDTFWKAHGKGEFKSVCGGLVSLPLVAIIFILLVLKLIQMVNYGIVMSNTQLNYNF